MNVILIVSQNECAGKSAICVGLGKFWQDTGRRVGYLKPIFAGEVKSPAEERSITLIRQVLGLNETPEMISPPGDNSEALQSALTDVSRDKDILIIEASLAKAEDLSSLTGGKILIVHDYNIGLEEIIPQYKKLSDKLAGIVINKIPEKPHCSPAERIDTVLSNAGLKLLGMIPESRILTSLSVGDLAEALAGKILNNPEKAGELIENYMMGSSTFDRGAVYYQRKNNKAVLVWGERPGYRKAALASLPQLALQTSTRCIVVTDSAAPLPAVLQKAEEKGVPLISAPGKLSEVLDRLEHSMRETHFSQEQKVPLLLSILADRLSSVLIDGENGTIFNS